MEYKNREEKMLAALDQVIRILRRQPADKRHLGRGIYRVLNNIDLNSGISTKDLAENLNLRTSSLNERLSRLEQEGYIIRERNEEDRRVFIVKINSKGLDLLEEIRSERQRMTGSISSILTDDEIETMTELAIKLGDGLQNIKDKIDDQGAII